MNLNRKIFVLSIFLIFISLCGVYSAFLEDNTIYGDAVAPDTNETDSFGCCSIVLQMDGKETLFSYRRDSNVTADVHIVKTDWYGKEVIKQYKDEDGYFCHVIVTSDGWVAGLGGIDDGDDNKKCEKILAKMICEDGKISESELSKIQEIKQPYGRGHVLIKDPDGNYGFANVDKLKTGKIEPGHYISIPNNYSLSRAGDVNVNDENKVKVMNELGRSDLYGLDRREIVTYDFQPGNMTNITDVYVSNEDGSLLGVNYRQCIDDVYFQDELTAGKQIPVAPNYKDLGSIAFINEDSNSYKLILLVTIIAIVTFVGFLYFIVSRFVKFIKYKILR